MTKKSLQKTAKKSASKSTVTRAPFERWLLPGILTITFYVVSTLIVVIAFQSGKGFTPDINFLTGTLFTLSVLAAFWWLLESARWAILTIERRSKPVSKKKK